MPLFLPDLTWLDGVAEAGFQALEEVVEAVNMVDTVVEVAIVVFG